MPTEDQPIEQLVCPKCHKTMLVRKGITHDDNGKVIRSIRCHTCGHEMVVTLSD